MGAIAIKKPNKRSVSLSKYAGKWVAFVDGKIIAWADTLKETDKKVKKARSHKRPVYFLVPRKDEGPYILYV